jgi:hypothetical protein
MTPLHIPATKDTPLVILNARKCEYLLKGPAQPVDVTTFYAPVIQWLKEYEKYVGEAIHFTINITSVCDSYTGISKVLEQLCKMNKHMHVTIDWYYDEFDQDQLEAIDFFENELDLLITKIAC